MFEYVLGSLALAILDLFAIGYMSKKYYKMKQSGYRFFILHPCGEGLLNCLQLGKRGNLYWWKIFLGSRAKGRAECIRLSISSRSRKGLYYPFKTGNV